MHGRARLCVVAGALLAASGGAYALASRGDPAAVGEASA
jgi:hypothetical protein